MAERTGDRKISYDDLNETAKNLAPHFLNSQYHDVYRLSALAFSIVTQYARNNRELRIKSEKRCGITKSYLPIMLNFLYEQRIVNETSYGELKRELDEFQDLERLIESFVYLSSELSYVQISEPITNDGGCCVIL